MAKAESPLENNRMLKKILVIRLQLLNEGQGLNLLELGNRGQIARPPRLYVE